MMADRNLAQLTTPQLTKLFETSGKPSLSERAKDMITELERRGFIYDLRRGDFVTCQEWNKRHGHYATIDCDKQARWLKHE